VEYVEQVVLIEKLRAGTSEASSRNRARRRSRDIAKSRFENVLKTVSRPEVAFLLVCWISYLAYLLVS